MTEAHEQQEPDPVEEEGDEERGEEHKVVAQEESVLGVAQVGGGGSVGGGGDGVHGEAEEGDAAVGVLHGQRGEEAAGSGGAGREFAWRERGINSLSSSSLFISYTFFLWH